MTPEEVLQVICPLLLTTSGYDIYIQMARNVTSSGWFGDNYAEAVALRAAHQWTLNSKQSGQAGVVTYLMEGRLAKSFGGTGVIRNELQLTNYGQQLLGLIKNAGPAVSVTDYSAFLTF